MAHRQRQKPKLGQAKASRKKERETLRVTKSHQFETLKKQQKQQQEQSTTTATSLDITDGASIFIRMLLDINRVIFEILPEFWVFWAWVLVIFSFHLEFLSECPKKPDLNLKRAEKRG